MAHNLLAILILFPIGAGIFCFILPDKLKIIAKIIASLVSAACLAASGAVFLMKPMSWQYGSYKILNADNLSSFVALAVAFFAFLITLYSSGFITKSFGRYFGYLLITLGGSIAVAFANDFLVLMIFWGLLAVTLYLLVGIQGTNESAQAARKTLVIIGGTDALMIFGIVLIWKLTGNFMMDRAPLDLKGPLNIIAYLSIASACLAKAGAMPFHSWVPDVAEFAPTPVTAFLPASLDKLLGIYLLARISLNLFVMNGIFNTILAFIGASTIIFAVMFALVQHEMKRLLGYHTVSQVGYMILGIGTGNPIGIAGGVFHMLNHTIYKSCLFLSCGNVENKTGTTDLDSLGGLARYMPVTFVTFLVASLSISGVPPFNGFVSKWMIYQGIIESAGAKNPLWILWLVAAMFGSVLTVANSMKLMHSVFLGRSARNFKEVREAGFLMSFPVIILALICFVFGVFAFVLPLRIFILPALNISLTYLGTWSPVAATVLILIGIIAGVFFYLIFKPKKAFRTVPAFVGGEDADRLERISGADFYDMVKGMKGLGAIYEKEASGGFDIYHIGGAVVHYFTKRLQALHNGVLPTYIVWCLLGMVGIFLVIFFR